MNVWIASIWMSSYCNFVQQEACILGLTNHGCFHCPCWDEALWRSFVMIVVGLSLRGYHRCLELPPPRKHSKHKERVVQH